MNSALVQHLIHSTLFAVLMGALAWSFRNNRASVRYWLWLLASAKFLIPFTFLVTLGSRIDWRPPVAIPEASRTVKADDPRFALRSEPAGRAVPGAGVASIGLPEVLLALWLGGFALHTGVWGTRWARTRRAARRATPLALAAPVPVLATRTRVEPGVFGILRPVLLMPEGLPARLSEPQLRAILLHEFCHIRRRDNLTAAIHMLAESIFWFHPLLWYIRGRLIEERERACDEHVLSETGAPDVYAEGILNVCRFYIASPLFCSSGVTGSNLKRRVQEIVTPREVLVLNAARKCMLALAGAAALAVPIVTGMSYAPRLHAQPAASPAAFEVASIKMNPPTERPAMEWSVLPGGRLSIKGFRLRGIISTAYHVPLQSIRLSGGPKWMNSDLFDIEAAAAAGSIPPGLSRMELEAKVYAMLRSLLEDRFKLVIRREVKEVPVYAIVVSKGGSKLRKANVDEDHCEDSKIPCHLISGGQGRGVHAKAASLPDITSFVENWSDRPIIDKTGLTGLYEIDTEGWIPIVGPVNLGSNEGASDPLRPTLSAVFDRLGLKMESQRAQVEYYVIESVEHPTAN